MLRFKNIKNDETLALLREGYLFMKNRFDKYKSDTFPSYLFGQEAICISGKEAVELFYDERRFIRCNAAPKRVQKTLTGENTVQGMDGEAHKRRKSLFMALASFQNPKIFVEIINKILDSYIPKWETRETVKIFDEAKVILCEAACIWANIPLPKTEIKERADDFSAMVDAFGAVGIRHWNGKLSRIKTEKWIENIIDNTRAGRIKVPNDSPLYIVANHIDHTGNLLESNIAGKEVINLIRPIVAISTYITFMASALHEYPEQKKILIDSDSGDIETYHMFVQEVRRFYPFTPFVGAKAKDNFIWNNIRFNKNTLVLLDIYGINHDSRIWDNPYEFQPERFKNWQYDPYEFIPHGGGDPTDGHRCPGESITVEIMKTVLYFLVNKIKYKVPEQNLKYSMSRIPTLPHSGFIIDKINLL